MIYSKGYLILDPFARVTLKTSSLAGNMVNNTYEER